MSLQDLIADKMMKVIAGADGQPVAVLGAFGTTGENCVGVVENITYGEGGEVFVKYAGCNYLFKGFLDSRVIQATYAMKRIVSGVPRYLSTRPVKILIGFFGFILLILPKKTRNNILMSLGEYFVDIGWQPLQTYIIPPPSYNEPVREIYRASEVIINKYIKWDKLLDLIRRGRDTICTIFQFDMGYRFRVQDFFSIFDKDLFKQDPLKELERAISVFFQRDNSETVKSTAKTLVKIIKLAFHNKELKRMIIDFILELDFEKIKFDEADWYYVLDRDDYLFGGLSHKERMEISKELDIKMNNHRPKISVKGDQLFFEFYKEG